MITAKALMKTGSSMDPFLFIKHHNKTLDVLSHMHFHSRIYGEARFTPCLTDETKK